MSEARILRQVPRLLCRMKSTTAWPTSEIHNSANFLGVFVDQLALFLKENDLNETHIFTFSLLSQSPIPLQVILQCTHSHFRVFHESVYLLKPGRHISEVTSYSAPPFSIELSSL